MDEGKRSCNQRTLDCHQICANDAIVAVGDEAKAMLGRTHRDLETIRPLQDGVIADFRMTDGMLQGFIER